MGGGQLERDQDRARERAHLRGRPAGRRDRRARRQRDRPRLEDGLDRVQLRVLAPDAEEGVPVELEAERLAPEDPEPAGTGIEEHRDRDRRGHR